jgi:phosphate transport system protein
MRKLEEEIEELKEVVLKMGQMVEQIIEKAIKALIERDASLAEQTIKSDESINQMEVEIDERCLRILALHQPMAMDMRFVTSALRIGTDLERIADQAVNIAERAVSLCQKPQLKPLIDIPRMAHLVQQMLRCVLEGFVKRDAELARSVCPKDDEVDALNDQVFRELLTYMLQDASSIERALHLIIIGRCLERIGDLSTNIAESVVYMVQGKIIKHYADKEF